MSMHPHPRCIAVLIAGLADMLSQGLGGLFFVCISKHNISFCLSQPQGCHVANATASSGNEGKTPTKVYPSLLSRKAILC